jgi:uncharacterized protein YxjI
MNSSNLGFPSAENVFPKNTSQIDSRIEVRIEVTPGELVSKSGAQYRLYNITFFIPLANTEDQSLFLHQFTVNLRFSQLYQANSALSVSYLKGQFPSSHFLCDYTLDTNNVQRRAQEIQSYLALVVRNPKELKNHAWHTKMHLDNNESAILCKFASEKLQQTKNKKQALSLHYDNMWNISQSFYSAFDHDQVPFLTFNEIMRFRMHEFIGPEAQIIGPNGKEWYRIKTQKQYPLYQFSLMTQSEYPLVLVREVCDQKYLIQRKTGSGFEKWCEIEHNHISSGLSDSYKITRLSKACPHLCLRGNWQGYSVSANANGNVATVNKKLDLFTDKYEVIIQSGGDIILFLTLSAVIDKIHHHSHYRLTLSQ